MPRKNVFLTGAESTLPAPAPTQIKAEIRKLLLSTDPKDHLKGLQLFEENSFPWKEIFTNRSDRQIAHQNKVRAEEKYSKLSETTTDRKVAIDYTNHTVHMTMRKSPGCP